MRINLINWRKIMCLLFRAFEEFIKTAQRKEIKVQNFDKRRA